jgi:hypothetical protein
MSVAQYPLCSESDRIAAPPRNNAMCQKRTLLHDITPTKNPGTLAGALFESKAN